MHEANNSDVFSESGSGSNPGPDIGSSSNYLIVRPEQGGIRDLVRYRVWNDEMSKAKFLHGPAYGSFGGETNDHCWLVVVSILVRKIIGLFRKPLEYTGCVVDFFLNLLSDNGGFFGLILRLIQAKVVIPHRGSETFISTIGQLDGRIDLYKNQNISEKFENLARKSSYGDGNVKFEPGSRILLDLCMMASKLAYENAKVVENVVVLHWKMNLVEFLNCWNDYEKDMSTQVFILTDKPKDASLILISFRGTEPFDADDWITDFDYSWFEIPELGKIHMGFIEAMGLGNREDTPNSFKYHLFQETSSEKPKIIPPDMVKKSAYYEVRKIVKRLLQEHPNAEFVVTGHSLGGALAILFPTVLVLHEETEMMKRLVGIYTFGQPRIGDRDLAKFMKAHLDDPIRRYFRVVYCNDLVPRLPYDDKTFIYKHFGLCLYYDSFYNEIQVENEPDPNPFGIRYMLSSHVNAVWELIRGLTMGYTHGPEYKEGWFNILLRLIGLVFPGISAHCPTDYVNSVRLGPDNVITMSPL